ncbi:MAG: tetratricopeptide repeat protein, partial [Candidatus Uhrbacteria bacterium]|nr:tetratricopeptide repeat protein [Candidatus Uhrbacteria bacterium]
IMPVQPLRPDETKTNPRLAKTMEVIMDVCLHGTAFIIPLFFTSLTIDSVELPKQTLLVAFSVVALIAWIGKGVALQSFELRRSWLHVVTVITLLGYGALSLFSVDKYLSFVGAVGQMPWSFMSLAAILGLYLVAVNRIRTIAQVYDLLFTILLSSFLAGLYGVFQLMGWYVLPSAVAQTNTFTSVGSVFSLSVYMVVPLVMSAGLAYHGCRNNACLLGSQSLLGLSARILLWATMAVSLLLLAFVDYWVAWAALLFGTTLLVFVGILRGLNVGHPAKHGIPAVLVIVAVLLLIYPTPLKVNLPSEVAPSAPASWNIAKQTLRDLPLTGSGPGTWIYDYTRYRDPLVNASPFWNVRFDRGFSLFLTLIATTGIIGMALWLVLIVSVVVKSVSHVLRERNEDAWYAYVGVFTGWATLTFVTFFYNFNVSHLVLWGLLLALLGAMASGSAWHWDAKKHKFAFEGMVTLLVFALIGGLSLLWLTGQRFAADVAFSKGVETFRANQPIEEVIRSLERARSLNPHVDMYTRNLSQAHLIKAAQIIQQEPSQEEAATAQQEIKSALDLGLTASTTNPLNVDNFANLAVIYQSIASFTRGADEFAIAMYREALKREPSNPVFIGEIGKLYLLRADAYRTVFDDPNSDQAARQEAVKQIEANLQAAEEILKRAVEAKPDYLPARYYLGVVYERQGKLTEAIGELANVLQLNQDDIGVAFELSTLFYRDNQKELALGLMEEVVRRDTSNVNAMWYLAAMYEEVGRIDEAIALVEDLAGRFPDNQTVQQRLAGLRAARAGGEGNVGLPEPVVEPIQNATDDNPVSN